MGLTHTSGPGAMHYGTWDTRIILELQRAVKSVLGQIGQKGSALAPTSRPQGQRARGLPPPRSTRWVAGAAHPGPPGPASLSQSCVTSHDDCHGRHTDRVCQGASSLELRVKMRLRQR